MLILAGRGEAHRPQDLDPLGSPSLRIGATALFGSFVVLGGRSGGLRRGRIGGYLAGRY